MTIVEGSCVACGKRMSVIEGLLIFFISIPVTRFDTLNTTVHVAVTLVYIMLLAEVSHLIAQRAVLLAERKFYPFIESNFVLEIPTFCNFSK